jgi:hypothetical protein
MHPGMSRTKLKEHCKNLAYLMMQRSRAWGDLVGVRFPRLAAPVDPLRSRAHRGRERSAFHLSAHQDNCAHRATGGRRRRHDLTLVKRSDAEHAQRSLSCATAGRALREPAHPTGEVAS